MTSGTASHSPKHLRVRAYVEARINSGELGPGDRLPTEGFLMHELGVSRTPVRQALQELAQDGWIYRIRGSGSYVKRLSRRETTEIFAILYSNQRGIEKDIIHGMRRAIAQHPTVNVHLILKNPGDNTYELIDVISELPRESTGGLVVIPLLSADRPQNRLLGASLRKAGSDRFVIVQLDRCVPEFDGNYVTSNHRSGARRMTEYLFSMGHHRIGCILEHPENPSIRDRLDGVRYALLEAAGSPDGLLTREIPVDAVAARADSLLAWIRDQRITAIFCFESELAREVYLVLERAGVRVPGDVSLVSFDDHAFGGVREGFLTAVIQRLEDIGHFAIEIVLNELENPTSTPTQMTLESDLAIRSSVARIAESGIDEE